MSSKFAAMVLGVFVSAHVAGQDEVSEKEIAVAFASPDSTLRANTWKKLTAEKDSHYRYLVTILSKLTWSDRLAAAEALAKAATDATLKKMAKDLKSHKDPAVRMGMADALAKMNDEKVYAHLYEALKDKSAMVRRMVVYYLRVHKKKEAVEALVDLLQKEKDPVVQAFTVRSLDELTQAYLGQSPTAWFTWWEQAKADKNFELGKTDDETKAKAEELGNKLKKRTTTTESVKLIAETLGSEKLTSVPILILPEYGISKEVMKPFLTQLARTNMLYFIDLPPISEFKNVPVVSDAKIPYYPIDQLVEAFEKLREQTGQERFALMACGMNSWIAMRYANLYPKSVSHLIFISPISSNKAYGDATKRMESQGKADKQDVELWHLAMTRTFNSQTGVNTHDAYHRDQKIPKPEGEDGAIDRRHWSLFFGDERDSLIGMLYPQSHHPMGSVAIPDYRCFAEPPKAKIPTIVIVGKRSILSSVDDCKAIAKHYDGAFYVYEGSSCMPFAEESELFNKHLASVAREKAGKPASKPKDKSKAKAEKGGKDGETTTAKSGDDEEKDKTKEADEAKDKPGSKTKKK